MEEVKRLSRNRVGRNAPCPCGSGRKYKRCHGFSPSPPIPVKQVTEALAVAEARRIQTQRQQGLGRPIISAELNGTRFVAIKNRLAHSPNWKTFHDFLCDYVKSVLGPDWGNNELKKPFAERHPILRWYHHLYLHQRQFITTPGKVHAGRMTGAAAAYLGLAYDLYALDHNAELQQRLIARLKNAQGFPGARYETFVAAAMIRAGFELEFENEQDGTSTHCEFTATSKATGRRFSVEAKHREPGEASDTGFGRFRVGRRLQQALRKRANHDRIVFIDINVPDNATDQQVPNYLRRTLDHLRRFESRKLNGAPLPRAYLFVTNFPFQHDLDGSLFRCAVFAEGFQIPDFKCDGRFSTLRGTLKARETHIDMHRLAASIRDHTHIPSTFDGEIPEFAFGGVQRRLIIGEVYLVKDEVGIERPAKLTTATVSDAERVAYCGFAFENGKSIIATCPLSESEFLAYKQYPDTFFGSLVPVTKKAESALELYDFFFQSYRATPKERLLELMHDAPHREHLRTLPQEALASIYCERCVYGVLARQAS